MKKERSVGGQLSGGVRGHVGHVGEGRGGWGQVCFLGDRRSEWLVVYDRRGGNSFFKLTIAINPFLFSFV